MAGKSTCFKDLYSPKLRSATVCRVAHYLNINIFLRKITPIFSLCQAMCSCQKNITYLILWVAIHIFYFPVSRTRELMYIHVNVGIDILDSECRFTISASAFVVSPFVNSVTFAGSKKRDVSSWRQPSWFEKVAFWSIIITRGIYNVQVFQDALNRKNMIPDSVQFFLCSFNPIQLPFEGFEMTSAPTSSSKGWQVSPVSGCVPTRVGWTIRRFRR